MTVEELTLTLDDFVRLPSWQFAELWRLLGEAIYAKAHRPTEQVERPTVPRPGITGGLPLEGAPSAVSPEGYELGAGHAEFLHGVGHGPLDEPEPPITSEAIAPEPSEPYPFACDRCGHEAAERLCSRPDGCPCCRTVCRACSGSRVRADRVMCELDFGDEESLAIALKVAPAAIHDAMRRDTWSKRGGERGFAAMNACPPCQGTGYRHAWRTAERLSTHRQRCRLCVGLGWFECGGEG